MENLKHPKKKMLFNSLGTTDLGLFEDINTRRMMLIFKKYGYTIPGQPSTSVRGALTFPAIGGDGLPDYVEVAVTRYDAGTLTGRLMFLTGNCPCSSCDLPYSVRTVRKVEEPGVNNPYFDKHGRFYAGSLDSFECTGALIDDVYLLAIEDDIITKVSQDVVPGNSEDAFVEARRYYEIGVAHTTTEVLNITLATGITTSISLTGATMLLNINLINVAATATNVRAIAKDATTIILISIVNGYLFTAADGGGAATVTVDRRGIMWNAKTVGTQFDLQFDLGFATQEIFHYVQFNNTVVGPAGNTTFMIDGTSNALANQSTANTATFVASVVALTAQGIFASRRTTAGATIDIWGNMLIEKMRITFAATGVTSPQYLAGSVQISGEGRWAYGTSDKVFREFAFSGHNGSLSPLVYTQEQPVDGYTYDKYIISAYTSSPALHGASHYDDVKTTMEMWVRSTLPGVVTWDPAAVGGSQTRTFMDESTVVGFTAATSLDTLLGIWSGLAVTAW